jgi:hypothetical protein
MKLHGEAVAGGRPAAIRQLQRLRAETATEETRWQENVPLSVNTVQLEVRSPGHITDSWHGHRRTRIQWELPLGYWAGPRPDQIARDGQSVARAEHNLRRNNAFTC